MFFITLESLVVERTVVCKSFIKSNFNSLYLPNKNTVIKEFFNSSFQYIEKIKILGLHSINKNILHSNISKNPVKFLNINEIINYLLNAHIIHSVKIIFYRISFYLLIHIILLESCQIRNFIIKSNFSCLQINIHTKISHIDFFYKHLITHFLIVLKKYIYRKNINILSVKSIVSANVKNHFSNKLLIHYNVIVRPTSHLSVCIKNCSALLNLHHYVSYDVVKINKINSRYKYCNLHHLVNIVTKIYINLGYIEAKINIYKNDTTKYLILNKQYMFHVKSVKIIIHKIRKSRISKIKLFLSSKKKKFSKSQIGINTLNLIKYFKDYENTLLKVFSEIQFMDKTKSINIYFYLQKNSSFRYVFIRLLNKNFIKIKAIYKFITKKNRHFFNHRIIIILKSHFYKFFISTKINLFLQRHYNVYYVYFLFSKNENKNIQIRTSYLKQMLVSLKVKNIFFFQSHMFYKFNILCARHYRKVLIKILNPLFIKFSSKLSLNMIVTNKYSFFKGSYFNLYKASFLVKYLFEKVHANSYSDNKFIFGIRIEKTQPYVLYGIQGYFQKNRSYSPIFFGKLCVYNKCLRLSNEETKIKLYFEYKIFNSLTSHIFNYNYKKRYPRYFNSIQSALHNLSILEIVYSKLINISEYNNIIKYKITIKNLNYESINSCIKDQKARIRSINKSFALYSKLHIEAIMLMCSNVNIISYADILYLQKHQYVNFHKSYGLGLRVFSRLGTLNIGYNVNINIQSIKITPNYYFSINR